jgi:Outer membrane protein beta-barrel domain
MKKLTITMAAVISFLCAANAQVSVGFTAGGTLSNYKAKEDGEDATGDSKSGFTAGIIASIPAGKNFGIQTGAHWVQKRTKEEEDEDKFSLTVNSIEIPMNLVYNSSSGFFAGAGPSVSFAVSGKMKFNDLSEDAKFGDGEDDLMRGFDFGANILAGYKSPGGFLVMANFNQGISNLMSVRADNSSVRSHYFGIRLGYVLKGKNE